MTGGQDILREALGELLKNADPDVSDTAIIVGNGASAMLRKLRDALSAQRDTSGAVGSIPEGMVPWHGGDSAPEDWDGGAVWLADDTLAQHDAGDPFDWSWSVGECGCVECWCIIAYTPKAQPTPAAVSAGEGMREAISVTDDLVQYIQRWGGSCRDCADEDGFCPRSGIGCGESGKAIRWVLGALNYGLRHGYITARESAGVDGVASVVVPREPTEAMLAAGEANLYDHNPTWNEPREIYRAMIAAAPIALPAGEDRHG